MRSGAGIGTDPQVPPRKEPVVRIRCEPAEEARCRAALAKAGFEAERSLTWLVVRDASPDAVNEALASGGAVARAAVRVRIGQLLGWLIDKEGKVEGRGVNLVALVSRVLDEGGLAGRYRPRPQPALVGAAREVYEHLLSTGAGFYAWDRFVDAFCEEIPA